MSPNTGTLRVLSRSVRCVMPPITSVSPSLTSTSVSARRLLMIGTAAPPPAFTVSPAELSSTISFILIRFTSADSYTTVGVTSSRSAASLNWICVPAELTVAYGISLPSTMDALAFSTVTISGLDSERVFVWFSSACSARFKLKFVPMMPNERPPAGRFEGSRLTMLPPSGSPVRPLTGNSWASENGASRSVMGPAIPPVGAVAAPPNPVSVSDDPARCPISTARTTCCPPSRVNGE